MSMRLASAAIALSEICYRYQPKLSEENAEIADLGRVFCTCAM